MDLISVTGTKRYVFVVGLDLFLVHMVRWLERYLEVRN